jgi:hypothetical protein
MGLAQAGLWSRRFDGHDSTGYCLGRGPGIHVGKGLKDVILWIF